LIVPRSQMPYPHDKFHLWCQDEVVWFDIAHHQRYAHADLGKREFVAKIRTTVDADNKKTLECQEQQYICAAIFGYVILCDLQESSRLPFPRNRCRTWRKVSELSNLLLYNREAPLLNPLLIILAAIVNSLTLKHCSTFACAISNHIANL
jgi:hypothetical protein